MKKIKIFIGYDPKEPDAYEVCRYSILTNSSIPVSIVKLDQLELRLQNLYWRENDVMSSTEFTFTRFLVPYLTNYEGTALFCDCDFLFTTDIKNLFDSCDNNFAIQLVKHDYSPTNQFKMNNNIQTTYKRKNWSSLIVYNCEHDALKILTPSLVNTTNGLFLHQFQWISDELIGSLDKKWNYLVDVYPAISELPYALHYTNGGPWFNNYRNCDYADVWNRYNTNRLNN